MLGLHRFLSIKSDREYKSTALVNGTRNPTVPDEVGEANENGTRANERQAVRYGYLSGGGQDGPSLRLVGKSGVIVVLQETSRGVTGVGRRLRHFDHERS